MGTSCNQENDNRKIKEITNLKSDLKVKQASNVNLNSRFQVKTINVEVQKKIMKRKIIKKKF